MRTLAVGLTLASLLAVGSLSAQDSGEALVRMVATERAFAAATAELGVRDGFLTFFAPDALQLEVVAVEGAATTVAVGSAVDALRRRPSAALPLAARLTWEPSTGQVSRDGSIGWLTGPYATVDAGSEAVLNQGAYFSIWKRQPDGAWRVWLDQGVSTPEPWRPEPGFRSTPGPAGSDRVTATEAVGAAESDASTGGAAWSGRLAPGVRLHRDGRLPVEGREAVVRWAEEAWSAVRYTALRLETAPSGDLAFGFGGYVADTALGPERGLWVRAWMPDETGRWRIVFELSQKTAQ